MGKPSCDETTYGPGAATSGVALRLHFQCGAPLTLPVWRSAYNLNEWNCSSVENRSGAECGKSGASEEERSAGISHRF